MKEDGSWRARLTFAAQQETRAKDRDPQADLSPLSPATLLLLLLALVTHTGSCALDVWATEGETLGLCPET